MEANLVSRGRRCSHEVDLYLKVGIQFSKRRKNFRKRGTSSRRKMAHLSSTGKVKTRSRNGDLAFKPMARFSREWPSVKWERESAFLTS
jgi:hypothetical protein